VPSILRSESGVFHQYSAVKGQLHRPVALSASGCGVRAKLIPDGGEGRFFQLHSAGFVSRRQTVIRWTRHSLTSGLDETGVRSNWL
jgi:hypothetical protein